MIGCIPVWGYAGEEMMVPIDTGHYLLRIGAALFFIVLIIFFAAWLLRRAPNTGFRSSHQLIEVLAIRPLTIRERLVLIQVGDEQLLIGLSPHGIHRLHRLHHPVSIPAQTDTHPNFAEFLKSQFITEKHS
jgi:flagellar protein FliO/FliZ